MTDAVFSGGRFRPGTGGETFDVINPADGSLVERMPIAGVADVESAVADATEAFGDWSRATPGERSAALTRLAARLDSRAREYAEAETRQTGKPIRLTTEFDVPGSIDNVSFFAGAARHLEGKASAEWDGGSRSASSVRSRPGTTRSRWPCGRSCRPSPRATPSSSSPRR